MKKMTSRCHRHFFSACDSRQLSKLIVSLFISSVLLFSTAFAAKLSLDEMTATLDGRGEFTVDGMDGAAFWATQNAADKWLHIFDITNSGDTSYDMLKKYTYAELEEKIRAYSLHDMADVELIGKSVEGRNIYSLRVGRGDRLILIVTGLQAREPAGTAYLMTQLSDLLTAYESGDEETAAFLSRYSIVTIPCGNPDGRSLLDTADNTDWRANANGVDLGLNFPASCAGQYAFSSHQAAHETEKGPSGYAGDRLGSEPETQVIMGWLEEYIDQAVIYIGYEQYGRIVYPESSYLSDEEYNTSLSLAIDIADFLTRENAAYAVEAERMYLRGWGDGSSADYAAELAVGFLFSESYGRLGLEYNGMILPLILYENAGLYGSSIKARTSPFACVTVEISTKGGTGYYDNARRNHMGEYNNCGWADMLFHLMRYADENLSR